MVDVPYSKDRKMIFFLTSEASGSSATLFHLNQQVISVAC